MTRAVSLVGWTKSPMRSLIDATLKPQAPRTSPSVARWVMRPCLPTTRATRSSSSVRRWLRSATSLKASAILESMPVKCPGKRTPKSPRRRAFKHWRMTRLSSSSEAISTSVSRGAVRRSMRGNFGPSAAGSALVLAFGFVFALALALALGFVFALALPLTLVPVWPSAITASCSTFFAVRLRRDLASPAIGVLVIGGPSIRTTTENPSKIRAVRVLARSLTISRA